MVEHQQQEQKHQITGVKKTSQLTKKVANGAILTGVPVPLEAVEAVGGGLVVANAGLQAVDGAAGERCAKTA
jgi:hypothetical protein